MNTSRKMRKKHTLSKRSALLLRQRAINAQRQRNRLYAFVLKTLDAECKAQGLKRADLAAILDTNPSQITRWLSGPGNWEIDTVSDLLFCVGGEIDDHRFISFNERHSRKKNFQHDLAGTPIIVPKSGTKNPDRYFGKQVVPQSNDRGDLPWKQLETIEVF